MIELVARILKNTPICRLSERLSSSLQVDVRITIYFDTLSPTGWANWPYLVHDRQPDPQMNSSIPSALNFGTFLCINGF